MAIKDENDIVKDILGRVQEFVGPLFFTFRDVQSLEMDIKADWGGDKPRINTARTLRLERRDLNLIKKWDSGASLAALEKEFRLSKRMIQRILEKYGRT